MAWIRFFTDNTGADVCTLPDCPEGFRAITLEDMRQCGFEGEVDDFGRWLEEKAKEKVCQTKL